MKFLFLGKLYPRPTIYNRIRRRSMNFSHKGDVIMNRLKDKVAMITGGASGIGKGMAMAFSPAKEAIRAITRVAANEFGPYGINVNLISPIANSPGMIKWAEANPRYYQAMIDKIPLRRLGELESDIGHAVFLASEDSDYITGQTIMVDGGSIKLR